MDQAGDARGAAHGLAVCVAHPDDEAYAVYGTVALHCDDPAFRLAVLHATDGDAGEIAPGVDATPASLAGVRRDESRRGWLAVGRAPARHDFLGLPDGGVADVPFAGLVDTVAAFLDAERPAVVVTFGPDGVTGHPDHVTVGRATDEAFERVRRDGGPGLRRLLHAGIPDAQFARHQAWLARHGKPVWDPTRLYHLRGFPDELLGVSVDTRPVSDLVVAGLTQHRTQRHVLYDPAGSEDLWRRTVGRESYAIAWPPGEHATPLRDVFEGL
ncbi:PIG-L deacetylase family protein [Cellulomonas sp. ICMP 17802]|uniref:PIG-L deacetylase family protein n=1 Tax=Cellulomonas sp. ICMP 17802 TaxID=3239199 RepID=UPI00351ADCEF